MRNACDSDSRCGLDCDASVRDAKSLAMRVERCEPLRPRGSAGAATPKTWHAVAAPHLQGRPLSRSGSKGSLARGQVCPGYLPFSSFPCFFWKIARKTTKKTRIFYPCRTPKIPGKEGENAQKNKEFLAGEKKNKEFQKNKERKDRVGDLSRVNPHTSEALGGRGGGPIFIENPRRGGGLQEGEGPRGREGVCGELGNLEGGGGGKFFFFFSGPKCPPSISEMH